MMDEGLNRFKCKRHFVIGKYVIVRGCPILFSDDFLHSDVVNSSQKVDSAGFFILLHDVKKQIRKVTCMGESTSLSISSRPEIDKEIISSFLRLTSEI